MLADSQDNAQGIPVTAISKSVLDDGTLIFENGIIINHIENNQLVKPKIPDPIIAIEDIDPQLERLNELENRVSTIEKRLRTVRCCIGIQLAIFAINFIVYFPVIF